MYLLRIRLNTTGIGFRIGFMVTQGAGNLASDLYNMISFGSWQLFAMEDLQLFISLVFIAIVCILMGAGIPTTALYIMLVSVAQPALAQLLFQKFVALIGKGHVAGFFIQLVVIVLHQRDQFVDRDIHL